MIKFNFMGIISSKKRGGGPLWKRGGGEPTPVPPPPKSVLDYGIDIAITSNSIRCLKVLLIYTIMGSRPSYTQDGVQTVMNT